MRRGVAFGDHYCWFVLAGALDIILTWVVLHLGGSEVNPVARGAIEVGGVWGLVALKFSTALVVIVVCELLAAHPGRGVHARARWLATVAVAVSFTPPTLALAQIAGQSLA